MTSERRSAMSRGRCVSTSMSPMTASSSDVVPGDSQPAAFILGPRHADELRVGHARAQRLDERGAERVPGRFARNDATRNGLRRRQRTRLRSDLPMNSTKIFTSGCVWPSSVSFATASASSRSDRYSTR